MIGLYRNHRVGIDMDSSPELEFLDGYSLGIHQSAIIIPSLSSTDEHANSKRLGKSSWQEYRHHWKILA